MSNSLASVKSRTVNGTGCPYCSHNKVLAGFNDLASQYPDIAAEWSDRNLPLLPTMITAFANSKVWWKCRDCGNEWYTLISTRSGRADVRIVVDIHCLKDLMTWRLRTLNLRLSGQKEIILYYLMR